MGTLNQVLAKNEWDKAVRDLEVLEKGNRNLLFNTGESVSNNSYRMKNYYFDKDVLVEGEKYRLSIKYRLGEDRVRLSLFSSDGYNTLASTKVRTSDQTEIYIYDFTMLYATGREVDYLSVYQMPSSGLTESTVEWLKIERIDTGNTPSPWTPAPEDVDAHPFVAELAEASYRNTKNTKDVAELKTAITSLGGTV